ncbi:MAG TPA: sensor histidine kinase [Rectinemataceae bacterium]|nr:sensor histidine kinase [Rectinemataceae bacterium]
MGLRLSPTGRLNYSVRWILIVMIVGPMLGASITVGLIGLGNSRLAIEQNTDRLFTDTVKAIGGRIVGFLSTALNLDAIDAQAYLTGDLDPAAPAFIETHLLSLVRANPSIASVYVGSPSGGIIVAGREGPGGREYLSETAGFAAGPLVRYSVDGRGRKTRPLGSLASFDARQRPWFKESVARGGPIWTDILPLYTGKDSVISAARPVFDRNGSLVAVVSVDLFLSQIAGFLKDLSSSEGGTSFILDSRNLLVVSPSDAQGAPERPTGGSTMSGPGLARLRGDQSPDLRVAEASRALIAQSKGEGPGLSHVEISYEGQRLLVMAMGLSEPAGLGWRLVTLYPEKAIQKGMERILDETVISVLLAMVVLSLLAVMLTGLIAARVRHFSAFAEAVAEGRWEEAAALKPSQIREIEAFRLDLLHMKESLKTDFEELKEEIERRRRSELALEESRREKELLLMEVHHRIKNNMNAMASLLDLQARASEDPKVRSALGDAGARLTSMMLLYDKLYRAESVSRTDAAAYLGDIAEALADQYSHRDKVAVRKELQPLVLDASILMPLGIIANELVTNAYKHAFPGDRAGTIGLSLWREGEEAVLRIEDDGVGTTLGMDGRGFGRMVVEGLVGQIGGRIETSFKGGTRNLIRFPTV